MEEKKLDLNSIIGMLLIVGIFFWMMYQNKPSEAHIAAEKAKKELIAKEAQAKETASKQIMAPVAAVAAGDSTQLAQLQKTLGDFAYSATLPSAKNDITTIENEVIKLKIANKGGYIAEATLKNYEKHQFHKTRHKSFTKRYKS